MGPIHGDVLPVSPVDPSTPPANYNGHYKAHMDPTAIRTAIASVGEPGRIRR